MGPPAPLRNRNRSKTSPRRRRQASAPARAAPAQVRGAAEPRRRGGARRSWVRCSSARRWRRTWSTVRGRVVVVVVDVVVVFVGPSPPCRRHRRRRGRRGRRRRAPAAPSTCCACVICCCIMLDVGLVLGQVAGLERGQSVGVVGLRLLQHAGNGQRHCARRGHARFPRQRHGRLQQVATARPTTTCRSAPSCRARRPRTAAAAAGSPWRHVKRAQVDHRLGDRDHECVAEQDLRAVLVEQCDVRGHRLVGRDLRVGVGRARRPLRGLVEVELPVVPGSDSAHHPRCQVEVLVVRPGAFAATPGRRRPRP